MDPLELPSAAAHRAKSCVRRLEGRDTLDLLHRVSTQSLRDLLPGTARMTLFCDFRGRLLHRAAVAVTSDRAVWLVRDDAPDEDLMAFIEHSIFRDDVRLSGPGPERFTCAAAGGFGLPPGSLREQGGVPAAIQIADDFGYAIGPQNSAAVAAAPTADGERARILAGRPRHGHEIAEEFNPFEVGLAHEVHLSKGCFTGQESLMRLITYGSVRRRLVRIGGAGEAPSPPLDLLLEGRVAGRLTSVAADRGRWVGLAVMRPEACEPGARVGAGGQDLLEVRPFPETHPLGLP